MMAFTIYLLLGLPFIYPSLRADGMREYVTRARDLYNQKPNAFPLIVLLFMSFIMVWLIWPFIIFWKPKK